MAKKGHFLGFRASCLKRLRCECTAERSDKEKPSDEAWTTSVGKPWEGVQVLRYPAGTSKKEKLQEWMLLM